MPKRAAEVSILEPLEGYTSIVCAFLVSKPRIFNQG